MSLTEEQMRIIEERIPEQGNLAIQKVLARTRAPGRSVTVRIGDDLVELQPNGEKAFLK
jgi:hypothetical protein